MAWNFGYSEFTIYFGRLISKNSKKKIPQIQTSFFKKREQFKSLNKYLQSNQRGKKEKEDQYVSNELKHEKDIYQRWEVGCQVKNDWKRVTQTTETTDS